MREKSILEDFAYQGPPSKRWVNTTGKFIAAKYEGHNQLLREIRAIFLAVSDPPGEEQADE